MKVILNYENGFRAPSCAVVGDWRAAKRWIFRIRTSLRTTVRSSMRARAGLNKLEGSPHGPLRRKRLAFSLESSTLAAP